jgi:hypothetical protein
MRKYRRITYEDRCQIYALGKRGASQERSFSDMQPVRTTSAPLPQSRHALRRLARQFRAQAVWKGGRYQRHC